jgi:hypothetical protein
VAEIAERRLDENGRALVFGVVGADPLAYSAIFPDVVRSDDRYKAYGEKGFSDYHLFEIPFGTTAAEMTPERRPPRDALVIIEAAPSVLLEKPDLPAGLSDAERARRIEDLHNRKILMLRYLVHVVGDLHQPLHVGNGVDRGANSCVVDWVDPEPVLDPGDPERRKTLLDPRTRKEMHQVHRENLHTVWDERLIDYLRHDLAGPPPAGKAPKKRFFGYPELVELVLADHTTDAAKAELEAAARKKPVEWLSEAQALHARIYPDDKSVTKPADRAYCGDAPTKIPVLDEAYARRSLPLIKSQIAKGGVRLVAILNDIGARAVEQGVFPRDLAGADAKLLASARVVNSASHGATGPTSAPPSTPPSPPSASSPAPVVATATAAATGTAAPPQGGCSSHPGAPLPAGAPVGLGALLVAAIARLLRKAR